MNKSSQSLPPNLPGPSLFIERLIQFPKLTSAPLLFFWNPRLYLHEEFHLPPNRPRRVLPCLPLAFRFSRAVIPFPSLRTTFFSQIRIEQFPFAFPGRAFEAYSQSLSLSFAGILLQTFSFAYIPFPFLFERDSMRANSFLRFSLLSWNSSSSRWSSALFGWRWFPPLFQHCLDKSRTPFPFHLLQIMLLHSCATVKALSGLTVSFPLFLQLDFFLPSLFIHRRRTFTTPFRNLSL